MKPSKSLLLVSWVSVTTTGMLPTLLPRDKHQLELRDPVKLFTVTKEGNPKETTSHFEKFDAESVLPAFGSLAGSLERGVGGYAGSSTAEATTTALPPPVYVKDPMLDTAGGGTSLDCPAAKPILEVSCVDRSRLMWNDFKITWGPAWNDRGGCRRLYQELDKRGLVTGFHCAQIADQESNTWLMEARGHRPRFPRTLVADAIRATFSDVSTEFSAVYPSKQPIPNA